MLKPTAADGIARPPAKPLSLSIVLPCFNEEGNIARVVEHALRVGRRLAKDFEVIIVNDGSGDRTGAIAEELSRTHAEVRVVHHEKNLGYGAAVADGLRAARCSWVFYTDGDGQFDLNQLEAASGLLREHDAVAGHRLHRQEGIVRRLNGWLWTMLVNIVFGLRSRDVDCAFKIFPREFLRRITIHSTGALISAELLCQARMHGLSVAKIGVKHLPRVAGKSTGGDPRVILRAFREMFTLRGKIMSERKERVLLWPAMVVALLALVVFVPSLRNQFTGWDDTAYTIDNPHMKDAAGLASIWASAESEQYYPLTFTMFWLELRVFDAKPMGYHAVSVVLHAVNALLVVLLLQRMGLRVWPATLGGALFAVHPVQVMSVAWIAEQKNLLSCMFVLVCMLAWLRSSRGSIGGYVVSLVCFMAALLSKSAVLGLPAVLLVMDRFVVGRSWKQSLIRVMPMLLIAAASAIVTIAFEEKFIESADVTGIPDAGSRVLLALATPWWYLKQLLVPVHLVPLYEIWNVRPENLVWWAAPMAWLVCAVSLAKTWWRMGDQVRGWLLWSAAVFLMMLGPVSGIIPYGNMHATFVSDHFLYIACIGPFALVGLAVQRVAVRTVRSWAISAAGVLIVCVLAAISVSSFAVYRDAMTLWTRAVERSPNNPVANLGLGVALRNAGRIDEALPVFQRVAKLRPELPDGHMFAAEIEMNRGDLAAAERTLRIGLFSNPNSAALLDMLGTAIGRTGRMAEAIEALERAAALDPENPAIRSGLGEAYLLMGRRADAEAQFREVERLTSGRP